jgi:hypothetical protein
MPKQVAVGRGGEESGCTHSLEPLTHLINFGHLSTSAQQQLHAWCMAIFSCIGQRGVPPLHARARMRWGKQHGLKGLAKGPRRAAALCSTSAMPAAGPRQASCAHREGQPGSAPPPSACWAGSHAQGLAVGREAGGEGGTHTLQPPLTHLVRLVHCSTSAHPQRTLPLLHAQAHQQQCTAIVMQQRRQGPGSRGAQTQGTPHTAHRLQQHRQRQKRRRQSITG